MSETTAPVDIASLMSHTQHLMNYVHYVKHDLSFKHAKEHHLTCVNFSDIKERTDDFVSALVLTTCNWVYTKANKDRIIDEKMREFGDQGMAGLFLAQQVQKKFRKGAPQGQFGELLLFNFLQHLFQAAPLLRKMPITTSAGMERYGADAIHYKNEAGQNILFLGESKCYESIYQFKAAFKASLASIKKTFETIDQELNWIYIFLMNLLIHSCCPLPKRIKQIHCRMCGLNWLVLSFIRNTKNLALFLKTR